MSLQSIVIAGTNSGVGKTTLAIALTHALVRRGKRVQTFKVGPDFLDPTYLSIASGRICYSLDGWMAGGGYCRRLFARACRDADFVVVEGVMGLFDGADPQSNEGSTAQIARLFDIPVLLVVDVRKMARSFAAVVKGYTTFETGLRFAGIIANRCGSARHAEWLSLSLAAAGLPPLLGAINDGILPNIPSRHLGLVTADQRLLSEQFLNSLADVFERHINIENIFSLDATKNTASSSEKAGNEKASDGLERTQTRRRSGGRKKPLRIGIARDDAFHFYYADLFDELAEAGCDLLFFSPLTDASLPNGLCALYIGGGYPELYADRLAANKRMLEEIRRYADSGRPLYAECGGLMYLSRGIEVGDQYHPFAGVLPARTRMRAGKKALGYVEVTLRNDSLWGGSGDTFRGHEFHYSELIDNPTADPRWEAIYQVRRPRQEALETEGFQRGAILASYLHLHFASRPAAINHFIERCRS